MATQQWLLDSTPPNLKREGEAALLAAKEKVGEFDEGVKIIFVPHPTIKKTLIQKIIRKDVPWEERVRLEIIRLRKEREVK